MMLHGKLLEGLEGTLHVPVGLQVSNGEIFMRREQISTVVRVSTSRFKKIQFYVKLLIVFIIVVITEFFLHMFVYIEMCVSSGEISNSFSFISSLIISSV